MRSVTSEPTQARTIVAQRARVVIEALSPSVDAGRFPARRIVGDQVAVQAHVFADGHDLIQARLRHRGPGEPGWTESPLAPHPNDEWSGRFDVERVGVYRFLVEAWIDPFHTWRRDLEKRLEADQDVTIHLLAGARLVEEALARATGGDATDLRRWASKLQDGDAASRPSLEDIDAELTPLMDRHGGRPFSTVSEERQIIVDPTRARASAWYELFPRSTSQTPGRHGDFKTLRGRLPYVKVLGFDVVYLPPIHPIGTSYRKGRNNAARAAKDDVGSPWAIGSKAGGHKAVHPELGTLEDFDAFVEEAQGLGLDVALDLAFQCSPDHPYVTQHPNWFKHRPDGSIQYAENPPKKYQDIYPFDFESDDADALWKELRSVVEFWIERGVKIFRVDNPHTKPFPFWEWLIGSVKADHPDVLLLAEAFTRPKVMYRLAKVGFTHSYTYFAWRNTRHELEGYLRELHGPELREIFRPHLWPNTPDILTDYLQNGGRAATIARFVLAATLSSNYGIYGPAFELVDVTPLERGKEDYKDSEKYQIHHWDLDRPGNIAPFIAHVNRIRRENPALLEDHGLRFHRTTNENILAYSRHSRDGRNLILVFVNLDPHHTQSGWTDLDLEALGLQDEQGFQVHDLLTDARYHWTGARNFVELRTEPFPAHIFRIRQKTRSERDFDYFA